LAASQTIILFAIPNHFALLFLPCQNLSAADGEKFLSLSHKMFKFIKYREMGLGTGRTMKGSIHLFAENCSIYSTSAFFKPEDKKPDVFYLVFRCSLRRLVLIETWR
jgi:hypothetical protein